MMSIVVGVDLGTTKITSEADRSRGRSDWDATRIVAQGFACLKQVADALGDTVKDVVAIGITGQQHGMLLENADGQPASPLINWQDRRALDRCRDSKHSWLEVTRTLLGDDSWKRTGCRLQPGFMAGTLFWLKAHGQVPDGARAVFIMDHFGAQLTGGVAITEPSCAGSSGVLNVRARQWDLESLAALGLPRTLFPEIREANQQIGRLSAEASLASGLPRGIPVFAPIGDHQASFIGSVTDRDTSVLVNVGTGAQVAVYTDEFDFEPPIELRPFPGGGNLLSNVGLAGGWSYQVLEHFFRDVGRLMFQAESPAPLYELLNQLAATVPPGADGLRCDPLFAGTRLDPSVRGTLTGLSPQNFTARHLARAVLEGMARSLREGYAAVERITGRSQTQLIAAGNGLRENPLLAEIVSESFGLPMTFTSHREEAAYGAALMARQSL